MKKKKNEFRQSQNYKKKLNITIGPRSRPTVAEGPKFGLLGSEFYGGFEFRFGSVGPGRSLELADRAVLTRMIL